MSKSKIDVGKAIEMRIKGATLRDIGKHFGTSPEAVRQALKNAHKKQREQKRLTRLLVAASIDDQGRTKSPADIAKTIDNWATILEAAKKGIALESEVNNLRERLLNIEQHLHLENT